VLILLLTGRGKVQTLKIGHNLYLTVFPEEIRQLKWLKSLYIVCTEINKLPDWIEELEKLNVLDISSNQKIDKLPDSIVNLKHLKNLILTIPA
jgi:Leucine-rich repeat (LRR) protein